MFSATHHDSAPGLWLPRRTARPLVPLLALLLLALGLVAEPLSFPTLTTTQGLTYKDVKVSRFDALELHFSHATGVSAVPLADLPPDLQKLFGYDPKNESVVLAARQRERARAIIEEADQKARVAAQREQARADAAELQSIRSSPLRCYVRQVTHLEGSLLIGVQAADKLPLKITSRSGKYERVKLTPQGKPELVEQIVHGQSFVLGDTLRILPTSALVTAEAFITVYLIASGDVGDYPLCALTPEAALTYRRKLAALKAEEQKQPPPAAPSTSPPEPTAPPMP